MSLQFTVEKKKHGRPENTIPQAMGTIVQFVFEQYFNQGINLKKGGQDDETMAKIVEKILNSKHVRSINVTYPHNKTEEDLKERVRKQAMKGFGIMKEMGLTKLTVRSEVKLNGVFRGFRMFALVDFLREGQSGDWLFDGKGHANEDADPRQLVYYALNRASSGRKIAGGGLIYWNHGFRKVDLSPLALREFIDGDFAKVRPIFEALKAGTSEQLEAKPEADRCRKCNWRNSCQFSLSRLPPMIEGLPSEVGFGELPSTV